MIKQHVHATSFVASGSTAVQAPGRPGSSFSAETDYTIVVHRGGFLKAIKKPPIPNRHSDFTPVQTELDQRLQLFDEAQIPVVFLRASLTPYDVNRPPASSLEQVERWLGSWAARDPFSREGLLLSGPNGIGKSFVMASSLRFLTLQRAIPAWFVDFGRLLHDFKACYQGEEHESQLWDRLQQVDILLLDDVGSGRPSDWAREILRSIIAFRYNSSSTTLITTNLPLWPVPNANIRPTFQDWADPHCFSRLKEMCNFQAVSGPDLRRNALAHNAAVFSLARMTDDFPDPSGSSPRTGQRKSRSGDVAP